MCVGGLVCVCGGVHAVLTLPCTCTCTCACAQVPVEYKTQLSSSMPPLTPKTPEGVEKLHKVIDTMAKQDPLFMDFTWRAGGTKMSRNEAK